MDDFELGQDACTVVRVGCVAFEVFPAAGGRHVLELFNPDPHTYMCWLDGQEYMTDGVLGLWDLLDLSVGGVRCYESEDFAVEFSHRLSPQ